MTEDSCFGSEDFLFGKINKIKVLRRKNFKNRVQSYDPQNDRYIKFGPKHRIMNVKHDFKPFKRIPKSK